MGESKGVIGSYTAVVYLDLEVGSGVGVVDHICIILTGEGGEDDGDRGGGVISITIRGVLL